MKFSTALTSLILIAPLFASEAFAAAAFGGRAGGRGKGFGGNKGGAANNKGATASTSAAAAANTTAAAAAAANTTTAAAAAANTTAAGTGAAANNGTVLANTGAGNAAGNTGDPQTSLTLDPAVIAKGFASDGQQVPTAGQVPSLTSTNNFINFCLTTPNKPITNGQQVKTGSCNPAPMGVIAATTNMPSSKFTSPVNGQDFAPNTAFDIKMAVNHLQTGNFVNAASNYYAAPQQVNQAGDIIGHTHFTVQDVGSFTSTAPLDPNTFAFFKGVNSAAVGGVVTESVTAGLPAGSYRVCSINTDANHTPCLVAVAQHGSLDDCVYFSVGGNAAGNVFAGNGAGAGAGAGAGNATSAAPPAASSAAAGAGAGAAPPAASSAAAATGAAPPAASSAAAGKGAGQGGKGKGRNGGRKAGGRRVGDRQSRLGRDY